MYAMPTHRHFETLSELPHFNQEHWYHWLSLGAESPVSGNTMCLYPGEMTTWTRKGYQAMKLCDSLCAIYKNSCEFRRQALRSEAIIAGVHNHVSLGMQISDFDVAFVDELPLSAFLRPRHIPRDGLRLVDGIGPILELSEKLAELSGEGKRLAGKALLDEIGEIIPDVYAQLDEIDDAKPATPWISRPEQVDQVAWFYIFDLLELAAMELRAWEQGAGNWLERIVITSTGLDLLQRADPWKSLPTRVILLDATGSGEIYKQLFAKNVEVFAPAVERKGSVYQLVNRLNGKGTLLEKVPGDPKKVRLAKAGLEALEWCLAKIRLEGFESPGAVTFMQARPEFAEVFGDKLLHFHGTNRGSNDLIECDAGFIIGAPQPRDDHLMRAVKILYPRRSKPFNLVERSNGKVKPARGEQPRPYDYFCDQGQAFRVISGFWNDPDLNAMADLLREQEIVQAIHRFRPITRAVPIYVLTSIPTTEPLSGITDNPGEWLNVPEDIKNWQAWTRLIPWLEDQHKAGEPVTYKTLSEATGIPLNTARRWKWLDIVLREFPDMWTTDQISPKGKRPSRALTPLDDDTFRASPFN